MFNNNIIDVAQTLKIKGTTSTPTICFDPLERVFEIKGNSLTADTDSFYKPVLEWINEYEADIGEKMVLNIQLGNYNTDTSRVLIDILNSLERLNGLGLDASVNWQYWRNDNDIKEAGMIFSEWTKIPFDLTEIN